MAAKDLVLVIDDNENNLFSFRTLLESEGWVVATCNSGRDGLSYLMNHDNVSLILMDVQMPDMDGFETAAMIGRNPSCKDIPILFISAVHSSEAFVAKGFSVGAYDYLVKPVEEYMLLNKVRIFTTLYKHQKTIEQAHSRLTKTEEKFRLTFEQSPVATMILCEDRFIECNQAALLLFECHSVEAFKELEQAHLSPELQPAGKPSSSLLSEHMEQAFAAASHAYDWQHQTINGHQFSAHVQLSRLALDHKDAMLVMVTDLTLAEEKVAAEKALEQEQHLKSLGLLAGGVAHDFNNFLMPILGNASLLLGEAKDNSKSEVYLRYILEAADKARKLARQMLSYSGSSRMASAVIGLNQLVLDMQDNLAMSLAKGTYLEVGLTESSSQVDVDVIEIQQILSNLVDNAADALGEKGGTIHLKTFEHDVDDAYLQQPQAHCAKDLVAGRYLALEISDEGCGMSDDVLRNMFAPFFSTKLMGRGLGMSAVLGIVRTHKGILHIATKEGIGSQITVSLPIYISDQEKQAELISISSAALVDRRDVAPLNILIIDDDEAVNEVLTMYLENMGCSSMQAFDGQEGIDMYQEYQAEIDGVILDMSMPKMTGDKCFAGLKLVNPEIKVLLSSGYATEDLEPLFKDKGLVGFLRKPYSLQGFEEAVIQGFME